MISIPHSTWRLGHDQDAALSRLENREPNASEKCRLQPALLGSSKHDQIRMQTLDHIDHCPLDSGRGVGSRFAHDIETGGLQLVDELVDQFRGQWCVGGFDHVRPH